jgi:cytochrome P450
VQTHETIRLNRDFVQNPHTLYGRLRAEAPAHPVTVWGGVRAWLITRYPEAKAALNDPRLAKDHARMLELFPPGTACAHSSSLGAHMLNSDPPDHTRLRKFVNKAFAVRAVAHLRPRIERTADELLVELARGLESGADSVDLMKSFARPLPIMVISALLGVPAADRDNFQAWIEPLVATATPDEVQGAHDTLRGYLGGLIAEKRTKPTDDLLSALVNVSEDSDRLSEDELLSMLFLLIVAGYETTVNLIGNAVLALVQNPAQVAALRADPALLPGAVEEFLRFESPLNVATTRFSTEPVQVGEVEIPAGELVLIALLAANHDCAQFPDPDRLDVTRRVNPHLAFGHGIHYCVGAPLARLEGEIALERLLRWFTAITLDPDAGPLTYRASTLMRGLHTLPVRLGSG